MTQSIIPKQTRQPVTQAPIRNHGNKQAEEMANLEAIWSFCADIWEREEKIKAELPYHINLIDLLSPKLRETAHSRILGNLLKQEEIWGKFIEYLGGRKCGFWGLKDKFRNPEIDIENERIDIRVRDEKTKTALIIENKINGAPDQPKQLSRYIKSTEKSRFDIKNIYIIYMPGVKGEEPEDQSWGDYKDRFEGRYLKVTLHELLHWLKTLKAKGALRDKVFLSSALEQYIDYLEGENVLQTAKRFKFMNDKLERLIKSDLKLNGFPADARLGIVSARKAHLQRVMEYLVEIEQEEASAIFEAWKNQIENKYGTLRVSLSYERDYSPRKKCGCIDISFPRDVIGMAFNVSIVRFEGGFYYGITPVGGFKGRELIRRRLASLLRNLPPWKRLEPEDNPKELLINFRQVSLDEASDWFPEVMALVDVIDGLPPFHKKK